MALVLKSADMHGVDAGEHTTVTAVDTVQTDLRNVKYAVATIASSPVATDLYATVVIPNQNTSPGAITIKTWKPTGGADATLVAATGFGIVVSWIAIGR